MKIKLPLFNRENKDNADYTIDTNNGIVIIGANGSGKSSCAQEIFSSNMDHSRYIIYPKKSLIFPDSVAFISMGDAEEKYRKKHYDTITQDKPKRIADDFHEIMSYLYAEHNSINNDYKEKSKNTDDKVPIDESKLDRLILAWNEVTESRKINFSGGELIVSWPHAPEVSNYSVKHLSDGELGTLYLLAKCLYASTESLIIIDEPESHLHKSLTLKFWNKVQSLRNDCVFIYFTHDLHFAASRINFVKLWIKDPIISYRYTPDETKVNSFNLSIIDDYKIPDELLFQILGSGNKTLFIEGKNNNHESRLYKNVFSDFNIIQCGSCRDVINYTKAINNMDRSIIPIEHTATGLIDRDRRTDEEIEKLKNKGIFTIPVAEFENLFLMKDVLLSFLSIHEEQNSIDSILEDVEGKFKKDLNDQTILYAIDTMKSNLKKLGGGKLEHNNVVTKISELSKSYTDLYDKINKKFAIITEYDEIIKIYNNKKLSKYIYTKIIQKINNKTLRENFDTNLTYDTIIREIVSNPKGKYEKCFKSLEGRLRSVLPE